MWNRAPARQGRPVVIRGVGEEGWESGKRPGERRKRAFVFAKYGRYNFYTSGGGGNGNATLRPTQPMTDVAEFRGGYPQRVIRIIFDATRTGQLSPNDRT